MLMDGGGLRLVVLAVAIAGCHGHAPEQPPAPDASAPADAAGPAPFIVHATTAPITLDGDLFEADWDDYAKPLVFQGDDGDQARPFSEIRFLHDASTLYVGLYAADEDVESTDFFQVTIGTLDLRVHPNGNLDSSQAGPRAASEVEGSVDHPGDFDEEWEVEVAVPRSLVALDGTPVAMHASRCDITLDHVLHCGDAGASLVSDEATGSTPR